MKSTERNTTWRRRRSRLGASTTWTKRSIRLRRSPSPKFDETVELTVLAEVDPRKADQPGARHHRTSTRSRQIEDRFS